MTFDERTAAVAEHGFTPRQAAFLTTVMLHAGVCVQRQYCAYARIVFGQVSRDFFEKLVARRFASTYAYGRNGSPIFHVHHKALYRAIGEPDSRFRKRGSMSRGVERLMVLDAVLAAGAITWLATEREKVAYWLHERGLADSELPALTFAAGDSQTTRYFPDKLPLGPSGSGDEVTFLYLAMEPTGRLFRAFLDRHEQLLRRVPRWRVLLVLPRTSATADVKHRQVLGELCGAPLRPSVVDEFRWFCAARRMVDEGRGSASTFDQARYSRARRAFGAPRFHAAYIRWCREGDASLQRLLSPVLHDAWRRGAATLETLQLPYVYGELGPLMRTA